MDFILELLVELVLGVVVEGADDNKCPRKVRVAFAILSTVFFIAFAVLFIFIFIENDNLLLRGLSVFIIALCVLFLVRLWYKIIRKK